MNEAEIHHSRSQLDVYEDISNLRASDLKLRIEEMLRIKVCQAILKYFKITLKIPLSNIFFNFFILFPEHRILRIA